MSTHLQATESIFPPFGLQSRTLTSLCDSWVKRDGSLLSAKTKWQHHQPNDKQHRLFMKKGAGTTNQQKIERMPQSVDYFLSAQTIKMLNQQLTIILT